MHDLSTESGSATIGFSQPSYTAMEGGDRVTVCIVVTSLTGQVDDEFFVGFSAINGSLAQMFSTSAGVSLTGANVGDSVLCLPVPNAEDNLVEEDILSTISAFVEAPPSITYTQGGDQTSVLVLDNDGNVDFNCEDKCCNNYY